MSDQGPPGAMAYWERSHNALGTGSDGKKRFLFSILVKVDGQLLRAAAGPRARFSGKEASSASFGGPEWRSPASLVCLYGRI